MSRDRVSFVLVLLASCTVCAAGLFAAEENRTGVDPEQAGPDYRLQGEYAGKIGGKKYGTQVIALGDGKFDLVLYEGGLPGDGWTRAESRHRASGTRAGEVSEFRGQRFSATATGKVLEVSGELSGRLESVKRESPTLGAKPPKGAIVLFDGKTAEHFQNGKLTDDGLLMANCESKPKFGDHTLHVEFRTPFKPAARGQARGNSGVYVQNRYEVQVLDSFGLEGKNNECGGIYGGTEPIVNMCYPPLTWQTYDIDFTAARYDDSGKKTRNARMTVKHNGVVIHDDVELPKHTPGKHAEGPTPDGLYLQGHGDPVVYRNIWVVEKKK